VQFENSGDYYAIVTNAFGAITSQIARITLGTLPVITAHPQGLQTNEGGTVVFNVAVAGAGLTYQWRLNATSIPGATNSNLTLPAVTPGDAGHYSVIVTGSAGSVASGTAQLVVTRFVPSPPTFIAQPVSTTVLEGQNATFSVGVSGTPPLGFRWRRNGVTIASRINDPTFTITNVQFSHAGTYNVVVTNFVNPAPGIISSDATLTVLLRPTLLQPSLLVGGAFEATLRGSTGQTHVISRSADLVNWTDFHTFVGTNSETVITDPSPGSNRFYRARLVP
jgi:hypothetical protein